METESRISYIYSRTIKVNLLWRVEEVYLMDLLLFVAPSHGAGDDDRCGISRRAEILICWNVIWWG